MAVKYYIVGGIKPGQDGLDIGRLVSVKEEVAYCVLDNRTGRRGYGPFYINMAVELTDEQTIGQVEVGPDRLSRLVTYEVLKRADVKLSVPLDRYGKPKQPLNRKHNCPSWPELSAFGV